MIMYDSLEGKSQTEQAINLMKEKSWVFNKITESDIQRAVRRDIFL